MSLQLQYIWYSISTIFTAHFYSRANFKFFNKYCLIRFYTNVIFRHIQLYDMLLQKGFLSFSVQPFYRDIMNRLTRTSVSRFLAAPYLLLLLCRHVSLYCSPYLFVLLSIFRRTRYCCVTVNFHMGGGNKFCPDYLQRQSCKMLFF